MPLVTLLHGYFGLCPCWSFNSHPVGMALVSQLLNRGSKYSGCLLLASFADLFMCKGIFPTGGMDGLVGAILW